MLFFLAGVILVYTTWSGYLLYPIMYLLGSNFGFIALFFIGYVPFIVGAYFILMCAINVNPFHYFLKKTKPEKIKIILISILFGIGSYYLTDFFDTTYYQVFGFEMFQDFLAPFSLALITIFFFVYIFSSPLIIRKKIFFAFLFIFTIELVHPFLYSIINSRDLLIEGLKNSSSRISLKKENESVFTDSIGKYKLDRKGILSDRYEALYSYKENATDKYGTYAQLFIDSPIDGEANLAINDSGFNPIPVSEMKEFFIDNNPIKCKEETPPAYAGIQLTYTHCLWVTKDNKTIKITFNKKIEEEQINFIKYLIKYYPVIS